MSFVSRHFPVNVAKAKPPPTMKRMPAPLKASIADRYACHSDSEIASAQSNCSRIASRAGPRTVLPACLNFRFLRFLKAPLSECVSTLLEDKMRPAESDLLAEWDEVPLFRELMA